MYPFSNNSIPISNLPTCIVETDPSNFREKFNQQSFEFSHNLDEHPLFEFPRLIELANTIALKHDPNKVVCLSSNILPDRKWSDMTPKERVSEAIDRIEDSGSLILIKSGHLDPDYRVLMEQILAELEELTGVPLHQEITWPELYIFISSPNSITPYHLDHESNFLFQIKGNKDVYLFNQRDRSILTEREIEQYFVGDLQAATYREENQHKATRYHLIPGKAVHHPSLAPHWVKNGDLPSVSLSINFCIRSLDLQARVYQVNHFLRKLGISPTAPGISPLQDRAKILAIGAFSTKSPEIKDDVVFSGIKRFKKLFKPRSKN